jgi:hypothetical protein
MKRALTPFKALKWGFEKLSNSVLPSEYVKVLAYPNLLKRLRELGRTGFDAHRWGKEALQNCGMREFYFPNNDY